MNQHKNKTQLSEDLWGISKIYESKQVKSLQEFGPNAHNLQRIHGQPCVVFFLLLSLFLYI